MRVACVQSDVAFGDPKANAAAACTHLERLAAEGVELAVFPEAFLTGYCVDSVQEASAIAIGAAHPSIRLLDEAAHDLGLVVVAGFAESTEEGGLYNTAALLEKDRSVRTYRKTHLPCLGLDRFVGRGAELPVFETSVGTIGLLICFDLRPPEPSRVLALKGAELIVLPTNWPEGAEFGPEVACRSRCGENRIFFAACNRVGTERGFTFIGKSQIVDPLGHVVARAGDGPEVIQADLDLSLARTKRNVMVPGRYETEMLDSRRPELYGEIVRPLR